MEGSENLDKTDKHWTDSQALDELAHATQHRLVIKAIDWDDAEAFDIVEFKLKASALTTSNHFRGEKDNTSRCFSFMLVLCAL